MALPDLADDLFISASVERRVSTEKDVKDNANTPDIALVVVLALEDFRGDIVRRSIHLRHIFGALLAQGCTKIDDFNVALLLRVDEDVLGLEVAMRDIVLVAVVDRLEKLTHDLCTLVFGKLFSRDDFCKEFNAVAKLGNESNFAMTLIDLVQVHDVLVVELAEDLDFVLQARELLVRHVKLVNELDGSDFAIVFTRSLLDFAEGASADDIANLVHFLDFGEISGHDEFAFIDFDTFKTCYWLLALQLRVITSDPTRGRFDTFAALGGPTTVAHSLLCF